MKLPKKYISHIITSIIFGLGSLLIISLGSKNYVLAVDTEQNTRLPALLPTLESTVTPTPTISIVTYAITPIPTPDTVKPVITIDPLIKQLVHVIPHITGAAIDSGTITGIEYSIDSIQSWKDVPFSQNSDIKKIFTFVPAEVTDGKHIVYVKSHDASGNVSDSISTTFFLDRKAPVITLSTNTDTAFHNVVDISGFVEDEYTPVSAEYSLDQGVSWKTVDHIIPLNRQKKQFNFTIYERDDRTYQLMVRASDEAGNMSIPVTKQIVFDRLPPLIGSVTLSAGVYSFEPAGVDIWHIIAGSVYTITASVIGGPTAVQGLARDPATGASIDIKFIKQSGSLWTSSFYISHPGSYGLSIHALDGAGNTGDADIGIFSVVEPGKILDQTGNAVEKTIIEIYRQNTESKKYVFWSMTPEAGVNPVPVQKNGTYSLLLPPGSYYLRIHAPGYRTIQSNTFSFDSPRPVIHTVTLAPLPQIHIGHLQIYLPQIFPSFKTFSFETPGGTKIPELSQTPFSFSQFALLEHISPEATISYQRKAALFVIANTWLPNEKNLLARISQFQKQHTNIKVIAIYPQEKLDSIRQLHESVASNVPYIADPDGQTIPFFGYHAAPLFFSLSKDSILMRKFEGYHNEETILRLFDPVVNGDEGIQ